MISAAMVKELRERTGAGMMDCKKALTEAGADMDAAADILRKAGTASADKKAGRVAAEGVVVVAQGDGVMAILEVNCETDFAARNGDFIAYADTIVQRVLSEQPADIDALHALPLENRGISVAAALKELIGKIGENVNMRRFKVMEGGNLGSYLHKVGPTARIGVIVSLEGGDKTLAKDIAMHIAASKPQFIDPDAVDRTVLEKEKRILTEQAAESGKPADITEKIVTGRINKFLKDITLVGQPFIKDPDISVEKLLQDNDAKVVSFIRFELGEGIEKKQENFAAEVLAQTKVTQ